MRLIIIINVPRETYMVNNCGKINLVISTMFHVKHASMYKNRFSKNVIISMQKLKNCKCWVNILYAMYFVVFSVDFIYLLSLKKS